MKIKKILVSQPKPGPKSPYYDLAEKYKVELVFRPFIKVDGLTAKEFRQAKINLNDFSAIIFTARTAVDHFFRICEEMRITVSPDTRYFCTSESIAHYLQKYITYRKRKISFGNTGKLNDPQLLQSISKNKKEKFLIPISDVHVSNHPELDKLKIDYTEAVMYRTVSNDFTPDEPFDYDLLLFFSPAGIESLKKNFPDFDQKKNGIKIGAYGPGAVKAVKEAGLSVDIEAPTPATPSMPAALDAYLASHNKK